MHAQIKQYKQTFGTKEIKKWNNTILWLWEFNFLKDFGAINENAILSEYPVLSVINKKGEERSTDMGGDIEKLNLKVNELQNSGYTAFIKYVPKKYTDYLKYQKQEKAISENEPPIENLIEF